MVVADILSDPWPCGLERSVPICPVSYSFFMWWFRAPMDVFIASAIAGAVVVAAPVLWVWLRSRRRQAVAAAASRDALRLSEATTRAILDAAADGIVTIDERGTVASFNKAATRIFGYAESEVVGRNVGMLMPEPYRSNHDTYIGNYIRTGQPRIIGIGREVEGKRKDGSVFPMELAVGESRLSGRRLFAGVIRDITARKSMERKLRDSQERLRLIVESVHDYAISVLDTEGNIVSWNIGCERMFGWTADEVEGRPFSCFFPSDLTDDNQPGHALAMAREVGNYETEGWRLRKDGSRFWAHSLFCVLRGEDGDMHGFVRITRDMTDQKCNETALEKAKEEAERANFAKSKFLAAASHDLRQPIQALFFFTATLASLQQPSSTAAKVVADMERSLQALRMLLDSLLDMSKLDAGLVEPQPASIPIGPLLDRLRTEFGPAAAAKRIELRVVASSAVVHSDPALLSRIVGNLVVNAIRYTNHGKILIGCRLRPGGYRLVVADSGIGIPPDRLQDIFEEFYQVANGHRERSQGLGLGLAIVRRLTKLLGHEVSVRSRLGHGSSFAIDLPRGHGDEAVPEAKASEEVPQPDWHRSLVLVIDDEDEVLESLRLVLETWGHDVVAARSQSEAQELLKRRRRPPDAIIADYRLREGLTGSQAIDAIRRIFAQAVPSIIITGDTAPERLREAEASGYSILHKPVRPAQLRAALRSMLEHQP